jgi:hypothetical protein
MNNDLLPDEPRFDEDGQLITDAHVSNIRCVRVLGAGYDIEVTSAMERVAKVLEIPVDVVAEVVTAVLDTGVPLYRAAAVLAVCQWHWQDNEVQGGAT